MIQRHPYDRDSLAALVAYQREAGDRPAALRFAEQLEALEPDDAAIHAAVAELRGRADGAR